MDADGKNRSRLAYANRGGPLGGPAWSPDSLRVAFADDGRIYVIGSDGRGGARLLADGTGPAWSSDGMRIAFHSWGNGRIHVVPRLPGLRAPGDHHADNPTYADSLSVGGSINGSIDTPGDADFFRVHVSDSGLLAIHTTGGTDTYGAVYNVSGSALPREEVGRSGSNFNVERYVIPGTHYVKVHGDNSETTGPYTIHAGFRALTDTMIRLTHTPAVTEYHPTWSPDARQIAYAASEDGFKSIWVMNADGTNRRRLTDPVLEGIYAMVPIWCPDSSRNRIAFAEPYTWEGRGGYWRIRVMDADGTNRHTLTDPGSNATQPAWSPDGRDIAFYNSDTEDIWVIATDDGSDLRQLTDTGRYNRSPAWSPDGGHIAFTGDGWIYVMDVDGKNRRELNQRGYVSDWSPDGRHIAFSQQQVIKNRAVYERIWVVGPDGGNVRALTRGLFSDQFPVFSPDGGRIIFDTNRPSGERGYGQHEIYVMGFQADGNGADGGQ